MTVNPIIVSMAKECATCIICLQNSPETIIFNGSCNCRPPIHSTCLAKWVVANRNTCPICRVKFTAKTTVPACAAPAAAAGAHTAAGAHVAVPAGGAHVAAAAGGAQENNDSCGSACLCCCCSYMCMMFLLGVTGILR